MHLTDREKQIAKKLLRGDKREAIAAELEISVWTVDFHLLNMRRKLGRHSMIELAIFFAANPETISSSDITQLTLTLF